MTSVGRTLLVFLAVFPSASSFAQLVLRDTIFAKKVSNVEQLALDTTDIDMATFPGDLILDSGSGNNLSKGKTATVRYAKNDPILIPINNGDPNKMFDGSSSSYYMLPVGQEGTQFVIDLQATRVVNRVVVRTFASSNFRIRGYSLFIGRDSVEVRRVLQVPDILTAPSDEYFPPDTGRFVILQVDEQDPTRPNGVATIISEIEIYGTGFLAEGTYTSTVRDLEKNVNWANIRFDADVPTGTSVEVSARTGDNKTAFSSWSPWSASVSRSNSLFRVYEPRRYLQYRIRLATQTITTPRLRSVEFEYDTLLVANSTSAQLSPLTTPVFKRVTLIHETNVVAGTNSRGIDTLVIETATPMGVTNVTVNDVPATYSVVFSPGKASIGFASTITGNAVIRASLELTPYLLSHSFPCYVTSKTSPLNPQQVDAAIVGGRDALTLATTGVPEKVIMDANADPNPFTPNGDGRNDLTYFSFFVANLTEARPVSVFVYDLTGHKVRTVFQTRASATAFAEQDAIPWDGRDDSGKILPPGIYLYQIIVSADGTEPSVVTKTVTLAY